MRQVARSETGYINCLINDYLTNDYLTIRGLICIGGEIAYNACVMP